MIVFDYDGFVLDVDPDEWASLDIQEQSSRKILGYFEFRINRDKPAQKEELVGHLESEMYREAAWQVWYELPHYERQVLQALETEFVNEPPAENLGECEVRVMTLIPDYFKPPNPKIKINTEKIRNLEHMLYAIRHELAHAAFRHGEVSRFWEAAGVGYQASYNVHETEARCVSTVWYGVAMDQWREKQDDG